MVSRERSRPGSGEQYAQARLLKELEWLRTLAHVSPVGIFRADAHGRCTYVNERWSELHGRRADAAVGETWETFVHPEDELRIRAEWQLAHERNAPLRLEHRCIQPSGRILWLLAQVVREVDGRGRITSYVGTCTDITELHQMREELQRSHAALEVRMRDRAAELQRMALIVETSDDAIISANLDGQVVTWNRGAERLFGYSAVEMIGQTTEIVTPRSQREQARAIKAQIHAGGGIHHLETVRVAKSGALIEVALSAFGLRDADGTLRGSCAILRDITEQKRAERRLRRLSWRLLRVQDEERRRIARELHDSTAQAVAALSINLSVLARERTPLPAARRRQLLEDSLRLADQVTRELRTTSYLLHPPLLEERGLPAALRWFIEGFAERSNIAVDLTLPPDLGRLRDEVEVTLFRVVQESLINVHRHSGSPSVQIRLTTEKGSLTLEIRDRGRGLAPDQIEAKGIGISGMKERLLQLGGTLEVESNHPGTAVIAKIPSRL